MTTYKGIRGQTIRTIAGDASPLIAGDIWYSSTAKKIRGAKIAAGAWATSNNINTARQRLKSVGTQTASMVVGGMSGGPGGAPSYSFHDECETYDGSSWTETADTNETAADRFSSSAGTTTAAVVGGAFAYPFSPDLKDVCELWNGTSWTEVNDINTARVYAGNAGTSTAALIVGGEKAGDYATESEEWDGTNWAEGDDLNSGGWISCGTGTQTAAIVAGGTGSDRGPGILAETYDGSSWTEVGDLNTARNRGGMSGDSSEAVYFSGLAAGPALSALTEEYDGSTWAEGGDLSTARQQGGGSGSSTASFLVSGATVVGDGTYSSATEEWTKAVAASSFTSS